MKVIAGDIGGTKTLLQVAEVDGYTHQTLYEKSYISGDYCSFEELIGAFLVECRDLLEPSDVNACIAVAGPVRGGSVKVTNLPWLIQTDKLVAATGLKSIRLVNDFEAIGHCLPSLKNSDLFELQAGQKDVSGPRAILGAGTGLGTAYTVHAGGEWITFSSEGGHVDFAPVDNRQIELAQFMMSKYPRVTYERLLSGSGLVDLYEFEHFQSPERNTARLTAVLAADDPAAEVTRAALEKRDDKAEKALDSFISIYGAQAGNLALTFLASGGIYVAGGIAPKIIPRMRNGLFMQAFLSKGRMRGLLEKIPVYVICNQRVGLLGAAMMAT